MNICRALGSPWFCTESADQFEKELTRLARKKTSAEMPADETGLAVESILGTSAAADMRTLAAVTELKDRLLGNLIRRNLKSVTYSGESISELKPYVVVLGLLELEDWEHKTLLEVQTISGATNKRSGGKKV